MRVVFSNRAYTSVLAETTEKIKTETGGLFLGVVQDDTWYIIEAIDPGPKSIFEIAYFEYDQKYTQHLINKIANLYEKRLELIGLWHRHPGSFDQFSSTDDGTNAKYASMRTEGAISALVNIDPAFRITMYHVDRPCRYKKIEYDVGDSLIPDGLLKFKTPEQYFSIMKNIMNASNVDSRQHSEYHRSVSLEAFMKFIYPFLDEYDNTDSESDAPLEDEAQEQIIGEIIDDVTFLADKLGIETAISLENNYLVIYQETEEKKISLLFTILSSNKSFIFLYEDKCFKYHKGLLAEVFEKAKSAREQSSNVINNSRFRKQSGVVDSVLKIIRFNRNEEE